MIKIRLAEMMALDNLQAVQEDNPKLQVTQRSLARDTGLALTTINRLYHNKAESIELETLETLCKYFECEPGDMLKMQ